MVMRPQLKGRAYKRQRAEFWGDECIRMIAAAVANPNPNPEFEDYNLVHAGRSAKVAAGFALDILGREDAYTLATRRSA